MKEFVIISSVIADLLDLTGIGHFLYIVDVVVIAIHLFHAGPKALWGILDMIPGVGLVPVFTYLAFKYD